MHKGVIWFLVLAFAGAWIPWEIGIGLGVAPTSPGFQLFAAIGACAPAAACFVVRKWVTREGFADAGLRLNVRQWRYYLIGWLLPLVVVAFIVGEATLLSAASPNLSAQAGLQTLAERLPVAQGHLSLGGLGINPWLVITVQFLLVAIVLTPVLWCEEFGWRSYLQIRIFPGRPLAAAVATGLIWAVWHCPLILRGYNYPESPIAGAAVFAVGTVLLSIVFGWIRQRTGSIWAASLAHSATNVVGGGLTTLWFSGRGDAVIVGYLGILAWLPFSLLAIWIVATGRLGPASQRQEAWMQDQDRPSLAEIVAYRQGQRAGLSLAALAIAAMAFVSLLGVEKSLLALVIAGIALRGGVADPKTRRWARLAIALAVGHWLVLTVVVGLYHQQLAQLIALLQRLS